MAEVEDLESSELPWAVSLRTAVEATQAALDEQAEADDAATAAASSAGPAAKQGGSCSFLLMPEDCSLLTASKRAKRTIVGQAGELV